MTDDMDEILEKLFKEAMTKEFWIEGLRKSFASLITGDESLGEHIYLTLLDESNPFPVLVLSHQLRQLSEVLEAAECHYYSQCGGLNRSIDGIPDLSQKPEGYKPKIEFFLEEVKKKDIDPLGGEAEFVVREGWIHEDTGSPFLWKKKVKYPWDGSLPEPPAED